jgi:hypothetical protein
MAQAVKSYDVGNLTDDCKQYFTATPIVSASIHCAFLNPYIELNDRNNAQDRATSDYFEAIKISLQTGTFMHMLCNRTLDNTGTPKYNLDEINSMVNIENINVDHYNALILNEFNYDRITGPTMGNGFLTFPTQAEINAEVGLGNRPNTDSLYADFIDGSENYRDVRDIGSYKGAFIVWIRLRLNNGTVEEYALSAITCSYFKNQFIVDGVASFLQKKLIKLNPRVVANALDYVYNLARISGANVVILSALTTAYDTYVNYGFQELMTFFKIFYKNDPAMFKFMRDSLTSLTNYFNYPDTKDGRMARTTTLGLIRKIIKDLYREYEKSGNRKNIQPKINEWLDSDVFNTNKESNNQAIIELKQEKEAVFLHDIREENDNTQSKRLFEFLELFAIVKNLKREDIQKVGHKILHGQHPTMGSRMSRIPSQRKITTSTQPRILGTASAQQPTPYQKQLNFGIRKEPIARHVGKPSLEILRKKKERNAIEAIRQDALLDPRVQPVVLALSRRKASEFQKNVRKVAISHARLKRAEGNKSKKMKKVKPKTMKKRHF